MKATDFIKVKSELTSILDDVKEKITIAYSELVHQFIEENSPMKQDLVYELVSGATKVRNCNRFIVYDQNIRLLLDTPTIMVSGWWMDAGSTLKVWETYNIYGVANPTIFSLSEDQMNKKHPKSKG